MPTYQVRSIPSQSGYTVYCEWCGTRLGMATTPADLRRLSAGAVLGLWPELQQVVQGHEAECVADTVARPVPAKISQGAPS